MRITHRLSVSAAAFLIGLGTSPVLAQTVNGSTTDTLDSAAVDRLVDRDLGQEQRIESGLNDGQLTTSEGARLERGEARIDQMESNDLSNGSLSAQEAARLHRAQNEESSQITRLDDNGTTAAAGSNSVLAKDVQRDINQQQRIDNGIDNGGLTATEVSSLEGGQAVDGRSDYRAGRNNMISASEQQNIRADENTQSTDISNDRHNGTTSTVVSGGTGDRDHDSKPNDKGWGHWSWDRPHQGLDRDDQQAMIGANANSNVTAANQNGHAVNVDSDDTAAATASAGGTSFTNGSTSVNNGSSTSAAVAAPAVTPVHTAPPVVTPHVSPPHIAAHH